MGRERERERERGIFHSILEGYFLSLWTLRTLWSVWTLWLIWTYCSVWLYGVYGRRRGEQLTNFLFASTCILVFEHRALVVPCMSRSPVFFSSEVFSTASGFFFVPSQTRAREKKKRKKRKREKEKKRGEIRFI